MNACIEKFAEIDTTIKGSVKLGDSSTVAIRGKCSIKLEFLTDKHYIFTNVYYISLLRSNIISLDQLNENGCKILINGGQMSIMGKMHMLLAKVSISRNRLYVLHITPILTEFLLASSKEVAWCQHARYGQVNFQALKDLTHRKIVHGLSMRSAFTMLD